MYWGFVWTEVMSRSPLARVDLIVLISLWLRIPAPVPATADTRSGSYFSNRSLSSAIDEVAVTLTVFSAPIAEVCASMYEFIPLPRPLVMVKVKAPITIATIERIALPRRRNALFNENCSRSIVLIGPLPPRKLKGGGHQRSQLGGRMSMPVPGCACPFPA